MVTFVFQATLEKTDQKLFSPPQEWPVILRAGEWVQVDNELDTATPVSDVWHWMHLDKHCIVVELQDLAPAEFEALEKTWSNWPPYLAR